MHGLIATLCKLRMTEEKVLPSRVGIGSTFPKPIRISDKKKASTHHITVEVVDELKEKKLAPSRSSAFDRIGNTTSCSSVFYRLGGKWPV